MYFYLIQSASSDSVNSMLDNNLTSPFVECKIIESFLSQSRYSMKLKKSFEISSLLFESKISIKKRKYGPLCDS